MLCSEFPDRDCLPAKNLCNEFTCHCVYSYGREANCEARRQTRDRRTWITHNGGHFRTSLAGAGLLGKPLLVSIHGIRRTEPLSVGVYGLVSRDVDAAEAGTEIGGGVCARGPGGLVNRTRHASACRKLNLCSHRAHN